MGPLINVPKDKDIQNKSIDFEFGDLSYISLSNKVRLQKVIKNSNNPSDLA